MFAFLRARLQVAVRRVLGSARTALREAFRPAPLVTRFVQDLFRPREELLAENAALRQQLTAAFRKVKRPAFMPWERALLVALASRLQSWRNTLLLVKPETLIRWHSAGFRLLWRRNSNETKQRQSRISAETSELIRQMARDNRT